MKFASLSRSLVLPAFWVVFAGLLVSRPALAFDFFDWTRGAIGYEYAITEAEDFLTPMVIYFHQDSCEWSRKMEDKYLSSGKVYRLLRDMQKVDINPDRGPEDEAMVEKFGIKNYPAFYIYVPALEDKPERVHPFREDGDMSVDEFVKVLREKVVYPYSNRGHQSFKEKEYETAIEYYETALKYDPESPYLYHAIGLCYHTMAYEEGDKELLDKAEESYKEALKIDRDYKESKEELKKIRGDRKKPGLK